MTNDELIESVAIDLHDAHQPNYKGRFYDEEYSDEKDRDFYRRLARAAILAVLDGIREPSEGQVDAAWNQGGRSYTLVYSEMIDAKKKEAEGDGRQASERQAAHD